MPGFDCGDRKNKSVLDEFNTVTCVLPKNTFCAGTGKSYPITCMIWLPKTLRIAGSIDVTKGVLTAS